MTYKTSYHAQVRMQQRGLHPSDIDFVLRYGTETSGGIVLSNKDTARLERTARREIEIANRLRGTFLPCEDAVVKTVFKASLKQQRRLL